MPDQTALIPIVNGSTILFQGLGNATTIVANGTPTVAIMQDVALYHDGTIASTAAPLPIADAAMATNAGSLIAQSASMLTSLGGIKTDLDSILSNSGTVASLAAQAALVAQGTSALANDATMITLQGSINAKVATAANQATEIANQGSQIAQNAAMIAQLGSLISGVLQTKQGPYTLVPLDAASVTNAGTAAVALTATHATAGGYLITANAAGMFVAQIGNAGTVHGGNTSFVPANTPYSVIPNAGSVTVNATVAGLTFAGYGLT